MSVALCAQAWAVEKLWNAIQAWLCSPSRTGEMMSLLFVNLKSWAWFRSRNGPWPESLGTGVCDCMSSHQWNGKLSPGDWHWRCRNRCKLGWECACTQWYSVDMGAIKTVQGTLGLLNYWKFFPVVIKQLDLATSNYSLHSVQRGLKFFHSVCLAVFSLLWIECFCPLPIHMLMP